MGKKQIFFLTIILGLLVDGETVLNVPNEQLDQVNKYNIPKLYSALIKKEKNAHFFFPLDAYRNYADQWEKRERKVIFKIIDNEKEIIPLALLEWGRGWEGEYQCILLTNKKVISIKFLEGGKWTLKEVDVSPDYIKSLKVPLLRLYKYNGGTNSIVEKDAAILFCTLWDDKFNTNIFSVYLPNALNYPSIANLNYDNAKYSNPEILGSLFYSLKKLISQP